MACLTRLGVNMKVLVFGGTGRVGSSVLEFALDNGREVTPFVRKLSNFWGAMAQSPSDASTDEGPPMLLN